MFSDKCVIYFTPLVTRLGNSSVCSSCDSSKTVTAHVAGPEQSGYLGRQKVGDGDQDLQESLGTVGVALHIRDLRAPLGAAR